MREIEHPPLAPSLMESMRSLGYSLGSALADLVDNSISANSNRIEIRFNPSVNSYLALIDDGVGMLPFDLDNAMRHGSSNPLAFRAAEDLGRFGLGLKTASLSQCRRMTVVSYKDKVLSARCWDMDLINERKSWVLLELDESEINVLPHIDILTKVEHGTMVLWENFDRLLAGEAFPEVAFGLKIDEAREHLALVFHRFLEGESGKNKLSIEINGTDIKPIDPFLGNHVLTQKLQTDQFQIEAKIVSIKPFILPHPSRITPKEAELAGGSEGLRSQQGFYVYRGRRLIVWGTWFRLARKDELSRLARVRVDIPNSLDHLWVLDIRKSIAHPPEAVRLQLKRTIDRIREQSRLTHISRGHKETQKGIEHGWVRVFADGKVRYEINREHTAIKALMEGLDASIARRIDAALRVIESSFPVESMYVDVASDQRISKSEDQKNWLLGIAKALLEGISKDSVLRKGLIQNLHLIEPFSDNPEIANEIKKVLIDD